MFGALGFYSAKGMTIVPSVLGQSQATAQTNLTNANLTYSVSTLNTNVAEQDGTVGTQSVSSGTLVDYETQIAIGVYSYTAVDILPQPELSQSRTSSTTATVTVVNYDSNNTYSISTSGSATFSAGTYSITGLSSNDAFTVTVTASRSGYSSNQASLSVSSWSGGTSFGGNLSVISTSTSSITLRASMWNTSSSSITWYAQRSGSTVASGSIGPFIYETNPSTQEFTNSGLSEGTTYTFYLYVNGTLASTASGTTGTTPPPTQTWYCRTYNGSGQILSQFTSSSDVSNSDNCNNITYCQLSGYPNQAPLC